MNKLGDLSLGQRVALYRRRRGMSQEVLAGLAGRTADWLGKVENDRIPLDRLSVIRALAGALRVPVEDLIAGDAPAAAPPAASQGPPVQLLRDLLADYRTVTPLLGNPDMGRPAGMDGLARDVAGVFSAYQASRYGEVTRRIPLLIAAAQAAVHAPRGGARGKALGLMALSYQCAAMILTQTGESGLAWIAAERGLNAAQDSGQPAVIGSLLRSVTHALLSAGRYGPAAQLTDDAAAYLRKNTGLADPVSLSVYGTQFLAGSMAAARAGDRSAVRQFLGEAHRAASLLGGDANHLWTAFGPANVAIHRVATAVELGDVQVAIDAAPRLDTAALPAERRVRHAIDLARAHAARNKTTEAVDMLLDAEQIAPEQLRCHMASRQLTLSLLRVPRSRPTARLRGLAHRMGIS
jgi:transcriptional regulator with XRE-family HTH domain